MGHTMSRVCLYVWLYAYAFTLVCVCVCVTACLSVYVRGEGIEPDVYMNVCVCVGAYM